jgi:hypothetical protein
MSKKASKAAAKQKARVDGRSRELAEDIPTRVIRTTTRGVEVECLPVAIEFETMEQNIRDSVGWPEVPTYDMTDVAGSTMQMDMSQEWVDSQATEEQRGEWDDYRAEQAQAEAEYDRRIGEARARFLATKAIRLVDPSLEKAWAEEHEWLGMTVPDEPRKRALHYFQTEIIGNPETDMASIITGMYRASGTDPKLMERVEASFRNKVGKQGGNSTGDDTRDAEQTPEAQGGLVERDGLPGAGGAEGVAAEA